MFWIGRYLDPETGRTRWACLDYVSRVWYFPKRYGRDAAERLAQSLNNNRGGVRVGRDS